MWFVTIIIGGVKYWLYTLPHPTIAGDTLYLGSSAEYAEAFGPAQLLRIVWAAQTMFPNALVETVECSSRKLIPENLQWFLTATE